MSGLLRRAAAAAALAALGIAAAAHARAELVVNGGFETGDLGGWTVAGAGANGVAGATSADANTGAFGAGFASSTAIALAQQLATQVGALYDVSFWVRYSGPADDLFAFNWNGGAVEQSFVDINPSYATLHYLLEATSSSTEISFVTRSNDGRWSLDDVSVATARAVALPGTLILALTAMEGMALVRLGASRRRLGAAPGAGA